MHPVHLKKRDAVLPDIEKLHTSWFRIGARSVVCKSATTLRGTFYIHNGHSMMICSDLQHGLRNCKSCCKFLIIKQHETYISKTCCKKMKPVTAQTSDFGIRAVPGRREIQHRFWFFNSCCTEAAQQVGAAGQQNRSAQRGSRTGCAAGQQNRARSREAQQAGATGRAVGRQNMPAQRGAETRHG